MELNNNSQKNGIKITFKRKSKFLKEILKFYVNFT